MEFIVWLEETAISQWILESIWASPLLLAVHAIGMGIVVGLIMIYCARVMGQFRGIPLPALDVFFSIAWAGFLLNATSGVLLFMSNASALATNWTFLLKIGLIAAGGISLGGLGAVVGRRQDGEGSFSSVAKLVAALTLILWLAAMTSGRLIAYTMDAGA
jgi:hypothetical protein